MKKSLCSTGGRKLQLTEKVVVVTGGASGIGRALCLRFAAEGARVVVSDIDESGAAEVAHRCGGLAVGADVSRESAVRELAHEARDAYGRIDIFCSNAGISMEGGEGTLNEEWTRIFDINVMSHVYASRAVLPEMLARGEGYLLNTVSAAGLLSQIGSAPYSVTKHAALAFAEWLSITYGARGIRVSALCPQGVRTNMLKDAAGTSAEFLLENAIEPEQVAETVVRGMETEQFLILPHPEVAEFFRRKAGDYDRWIRGMRRLQSRTAGVK